jgi:hypothetical protein
LAVRPTRKRARASIISVARPVVSRPEQPVSQAERPASAAAASSQHRTISVEQPPAVSRASLVLNHCNSLNLRPALSTALEPGQSVSVTARTALAPARSASLAVTVPAPLEPAGLALVTVRTVLRLVRLVSVTAPTVLRPVRLASPVPNRCNTLNRRLALRVGRLASPARPTVLKLARSVSLAVLALPSELALASVCRTRCSTRPRRRPSPVWRARSPASAAETPLEQPALEALLPAAVLVSEPPLAAVVPLPGFERVLLVPNRCSILTQGPLPVLQRRPSARIASAAKPGPLWRGRVLPALTRCNSPRPKRVWRPRGPVLPLVVGFSVEGSI